MVNTITKTTLIDGPRNFVVLVNILGDGSGDETNTLLIDRSTFSGTDTLETAVARLEGDCGGFAATLSFDATTDLVFARLPDTQWFTHCWEDIGGVSSNKAGAGANGDILLSTTGLGANERGTFTIWMRKA